VTPRAAGVATRDVHLAFGANRVLRGVDLDVAAGSAACLIGPSGSGKSTLLRCVNRLLEPDRGDVLIGGRSVMGDDPDALRQRVGMVFQHFNLFPHKSVLANVTLGLRRLRGMSRDCGTWPSRPGRAAPRPRRTARRAAPTPRCVRAHRACGR
jgi:polar amino acid transport system ATP-binding protein